MTSLFSRPDPKIIQVPFQSTSDSTAKIQPYAPVEPYLQFLLPEIAGQFTDAPQLYTGSLVPDDSAQTLAARNIYGQVGEAASGLAPSFQNLFSADLARAQADPTTDPIYQAQVNSIAQQARDMTERDKLTAQQQAIQAGQFGLGSTALREMEFAQQQKREELAQRQIASALEAAEARRIAAGQRAPGFAQQALQAQITPATLQEGIGQQVEAKQAAQLSDSARLAQQQQEAERAQLVTLSNLLGGLAGLGSQTQLTGTNTGFGGQAFSAGASPFVQGLGLAGTLAKGGFFG